MPTSPHHAASFEALAQAYVRRRLPGSRPIDIANAVKALRERIDRGELAVDAVVGRLQREVGDSATRAPTAFGDMARAVRDLDGGRLSMAERRFVADMVGRGFSFQPSTKQNAWLRMLFDRLSRRVA